MTIQPDSQAAASREEVQRVFDLQRRTRWSARKTTAEQRKQTLLRLREALSARTDDIVKALADDMGRPADVAAMEVFQPIRKIDETIKHLDDWMAPTPVSNLVQASSAAIRWEPRGVVLLFGPWNFPISLVFEPLVALLAAGNTAVVKPNEIAPASSRITAEIIRDVFEEREVAAIEGGIDVAEALLELPFDHIFLTGSPKVGRAVMAAAAKNLSSVTLELGGKSPAIIDTTADLDAVVDQLGVATMVNCGQVCLSVDYILVPNRLRDELVTRLSAFFKNTFYADGVYQASRNSRIVNGANFKRLKGYLDDAVERGATVAFGGKAYEDALVIEPTILIDVPAEADVLSNEIFGPIVPVVGYDDVDNIISHVRGGTNPLAMFIFSKDNQFVEQVLENTSSGGVTVNGWAVHYWEDALPFGGIGDSGMGRYHGIAGFREFSHSRAVAFG
ncbi:Aldehyde dehydrogenase [Paraburkholderia sediminicola]|uniref:Aldehyde dehydrogenase n=1 Tax=Paraburkholderia sediminicola TaxID=458836 RepID=A0A6J5CQ78_9BURK|nr:aldehyde dehydrogenase family protein [Paraburkholderia sediminicola]CAB3741033.1 Aldehyde dehydrogenase [Paraburkholderia sediminicola]